MAEDKHTIYKESNRAKAQAPKALSLSFRDRSISISRTFVIGRDEGLDIVIKDDPLVSRRHAMIELAQGVYRIHDLGSTNGTYVNNNPLRKGEQRVLAAGDVIMVGKTKITVSGSLSNA